MNATPIGRIRGVQLAVHKGWGWVLQWAGSAQGRAVMLVPPLLALATLELLAMGDARRERRGRPVATARTAQTGGSMSSSSTEPPATDVRRRTFLSVDRSGLVRLGVAVAFAVAALLSPLVGSTSAQFTDSAEVSITFFVHTRQPSAGPA